MPKMTGLRNFNSRHLLTIFVPALIAFLSAYWFRKKKKIKFDLDNENKISAEVISIQKTPSSSKLHGGQLVLETDVSKTFAPEVDSMSNSIDQSITIDTNSDYSPKNRHNYVKEYDANGSVFQANHVDCLVVNIMHEEPSPSHLQDELLNTKPKFSVELSSSVANEVTSSVEDALEAQHCIEQSSISESISATDLEHDKIIETIVQCDVAKHPISDFSSANTCDDSITSLIEAVDFVQNSDIDVVNSAAQKSSPTTTGSPVSHNQDSDCEAPSSIGTSSMSLNELFSNSPVDSVKENFHLDNIVDETTPDDSGKGSTLNHDPVSSSSLSSELSDLLPSDETRKGVYRYMQRSNADVLCRQEYGIAEHCSEGSDHFSFYDDSNSSTSIALKKPDSMSEVSAVSHCGGMGYVPVMASKSYEPQSSNHQVYEFELQQELCGRLIGRQGKHVKFIKERSNATVYIKRHPSNPQLKIGVVEGLRNEVNDALELVRKKFPISQYPNVTLAQSNLSLHLPENTSIDVILSSMVTAGHFFLQQPTHPTHPSLTSLDHCMLACYSQTDAPHLPESVEAGIVCAAPTMGGWYRAQVIFVSENGEECDIRFVDYGGYSQVPISSLRQIRTDFMTLPFQATECYLACVQPIDADASWSTEACAAFEEMAQGQILQTVIVDYHENSIPYVYLYRVQGITSTFINQELVSRGFAKWVEQQ